MLGKGGGLKMVFNYTNSTYIDLTKLNAPPNITIDISTDWNVINSGVQNIFTQFSWLETAQSVGIFAVFYILFSNQKILNLTNWQIVLAASFATIIFNVFMHYGKYYTSFHMLGTFFVVWIISLIATIRDN